VAAAGEAAPDPVEPVLGAADASVGRCPMLEKQQPAARPKDPKPTSRTTPAACGTMLARSRRNAGKQHAKLTSDASTNDANAFMACQSFQCASRSQASGICSLGSAPGPAAFARR